MIWLKKIKNETVDIHNQEISYLPKMEEPHITVYKESLRHSIYQLPVHNCFSTPPVPCSTDSPRSPKISPLNPQKIYLFIYFIFLKKIYIEQKKKKKKKTI